MSNRFYRSWINNNLKTFNISYKETDLLIRSTEKLPDLCLNTVIKLRNKLDKFIKHNPQFKKSLTPVSLPENTPSPILKMNQSAKVVNVGPMATVAGLFSETIGQVMLKKSDQVIVENGGDIYLSVEKDPVIGIYAGDKSPFTNKIGIKIAAENTPVGICTSAGTIGPSLSKGKADAVIVMSPETTLADAAATAIGNKVQTKSDINDAVKQGRNIKKITGIIVIKKDNIGMWGDLELIKI